MNFKFNMYCLLAAVTLAGCATTPIARLGPAGTCPLPLRAGVPEYTCKHCNCIMQVAEGEWQQPCNVCNCKKTFKECL